MPRRPLYITAEGRYDLAAIMRAAHALYRRLRPNFPQATLAGQMRAIWSDARREMRDALVGRIAGRNSMLAACISLMPTPTMRQHAADLGV
jgi:hypothetical protein